MRVAQRASTGALPPKAAVDPSPDEAEQSIIDGVKARDHAAFESIFRRHVSRVYRQACGLVGNEAEAEEVVQDVFLAVYEKANTFRGDSAFSTWLYRLTLNAAITKLRRRKTSKEISHDHYLPRFREDGHHLVRPVVDWSHEFDERLQREESQRIIQQALDQLPPTDKAVIVLSDLEGVSNREISEALRLSIPAVKARLHRARLFLRGRLAVSLGHSPT